METIRGLFSLINERALNTWGSLLIVVISPFIALLLLDMKHHRAKVFNAAVVMAVALVMLRLFGQLRYGNLLGWYATVPTLILAVLWVIGLVLCVRLRFADKGRKPPVE